MSFKMGMNVEVVLFEGEESIPTIAKMLEWSDKEQKAVEEDFYKFETLFIRNLDQVFLAKKGDYIVKFPIKDEWWNIVRVVPEEEFMEYFIPIE